MLDLIAGAAACDRTSWARVRERPPPRVRATRVRPYTNFEMAAVLRDRNGVVLLPGPARVPNSLNFGPVKLRIQGVLQTCPTSRAGDAIKRVRNNMKKQ